VARGRGGALQRRAHGSHHHRNLARHRRGADRVHPVSSTGHLILAAELLGYSAETWATFNVIIQLGAILAVIVLYWRTFWDVMTG
jgi:hypothetical protein